MLVPNNNITFSFTGKERDSETGFGYFGARYYASSLPAQHLLYLPFGEHFVNEQSSGYFERFTFTGKERDAETGYYYHGARFNSSDIGWLSVDPMADKYPSMTPYNYCAWNPVKLVDPDGREIVIIGDIGTPYTWNNGSIYRSGYKVKALSAGFVKETANSLNKINKTKEGKKVLERLSKSNNKYFISRKQYNSSPSAFVESEKKLYMNGITDFSVLSHELFHAFQYDNKRYGRSIYKEVEAYVFQAMVSNSLGKEITYNNSGITAFYMLDKKDVAKYDSSMRTLVNKFSYSAFEYAISNFKDLSNANNHLRYKDYPLKSSGEDIRSSLLIQLYK